MAFVSLMMAIFLHTQIIDEMIHGTSDSTSNSPAAPSSDDTEDVGTSSSSGTAHGSAEAEGGSSENGPAAGQSAPHQQRTARKRKRTSGVCDYRQAQLTEQRLLREAFESAHSREMELRERHLKLQEKLVNCMVHFFGPPE